MASNQFSISITNGIANTNYELYRRQSLYPTSPWTLHRVGVTGQTNFVANTEGEAASLFQAVVSREADLDGTFVYKPPLGWTTWFAYFGILNETVIREQADFMFTNHLVDYGWKTIVVSDGWQGGRDTNGNLLANAGLFPSGMPALGKYLADRGLRMGIYTEPHELTSIGGTGSAGHFDQDAATFAQWGVKYVQFDADWADSTPEQLNQWIEGQVVEWRASMDRANLNAFLTCGGFGNGFAYWPPAVWFDPWIPQELNSWRLAVDGDLEVFDPGDSLFTNALAHFDHAALWPDFVGPGHIMDPDVLPVYQLSSFGRIDPSDFSPDQAKGIAAMQALLAAPLIVDNFPDPVEMPESFSQIMTNVEFLQVDQDPLCLMARVVSATNSPGVQVWAKPMVDGSVAVGILNRGQEASAARFSFGYLGLTNSVCTIRDIWQRAVIGYSTNSFAWNVKPQFAQLLRIYPGILPPFSPGTNFLSDIGWLAGSLNGTTNNPPVGASAVRIYRDGVHDAAAPLKSCAPTNMVMAGKLYSKGLGLCPNGSLTFFLGGWSFSFHGEFGVDDLGLASGAAVRFQVRGDGYLLWDSGVLVAGHAPVIKDLHLYGVNRLEIVTLGAGPESSASWADLGNAYLDWEFE